MFNLVVIVGNISSNIDLRYTPQGNPVCNFSLAVNRKYKDQEETYYGSVTVWGKQAENCSKYLGKGSKVLIRGRLAEQKWEKDGEKRSKTIIIADEVKFLSSKKKAEGDSGDDAVPEEQEPF